VFFASREVRLRLDRSIIGWSAIFRIVIFPERGKNLVHTCGYGYKHENGSDEPSNREQMREKMSEGVPHNG
jgi:hypothetical protein